MNPNTADTEAKLDLDTVLTCLDSFGLIEERSVIEQKETKYNHLETDSRNLSKQDIFLAYKGVSIDGHDFIAKAQHEASLIIFQDSRAKPEMGSWIRVNNSRAAWACLASAQFAHPTKQMTMIGVTGTNGKTSTVWFLRELWRADDIPCATIGTLGAWIDDEFIPTIHTTPDPPHLYKLLRDAVEAGVKYCAMEVSSHAIEQKKLFPIRFDRTVFTSFSRDHLDLHGDMDSYLRAKLELFSTYSKPETRAFIARKICDEHVAAIKNSTRYGIDDVKVIPSPSKLGSQIEFSDLSGEIGLVGETNIENFIAARQVFLSLGHREKLDHWKHVNPVPGRSEVVSDGEGPTVLIDYAHTPDALELLLKAQRKATKGLIHVVFGCGGDRDKGKRAQMGKAAGAFADMIWLTNDNPRSEPPADIFEDILRGIVDRDHVKIIEDRRAAIFEAIASAGEQDYVIIAGKGHEDYMLIGEETFEFDDRKVAREAIGARS